VVTRPRSALWLTACGALSAAAGSASSVAVGHMALTARYGVICGLDHGGHCWACYAAPVLVAAAAAAWSRRPSKAPAALRIRR